MDATDVFLLFIFLISGPLEVLGLRRWMPSPKPRVRTIE